MTTERYYIRFEKNSEKQKRWGNIMQLSKGKAMNKVTDMLLDLTDATDEEIVRLASKCGKVDSCNKSVKNKAIFHKKNPLFGSHPYSHDKKFDSFTYNSYLAERGDNVNWLLKHCDERLVKQINPSSYLLDTLNSYRTLRSTLCNEKDYRYIGSVGKNVMKDILFYSAQLKNDNLTAKKVLSEEQLNNMTKICTKENRELSLELIDHIISTYNNHARIKNAMKRYTYTRGAKTEFNDAEYAKAQGDMQRCVLKETYLQNGLPTIYRLSPYNSVSLTEAVYSYRPNVNYRLSLLGVLDCLIAMNISVTSSDITSMSNPSDMIYGVKQKLFSAIMSSYKMFKKADSSLRESTREVLVERLNNISNDFCRGHWKFCVNEYADYDDATFAKVEKEQKQNKKKTKAKAKTSTGGSRGKQLGTFDLNSVLKSSNTETETEEKE